MVSFDIHGKFSLRVYAEQNRQIEDYLEKELGYFKSEITSPDLEVELVDRIPGGQIILPYYGRNDDIFYMNDPYGHKISLSYRALKQRLVAEKKINAGFLLHQIIEPLMLLILLDKGYTFLHASAVSKANSAVIFAGAQDTGKTSFALAMLSRDYSFLGNEWVLISKEGFTYPYPRPIRLTTDNFRDFPELIKSVAKNSFGRQRVRSEILISTIKSKMGLGRSTHLSLRAIDLVLRNIVNIRIIDAQQFSGTGNVSKIERVFILERNAQASEVNLNKIEDKEEVATKLSANLLWERDTFTKHYLAYLFAFPAARNPAVEDILKLHSGIISEALKDVPCFQVTLPENTPFKENIKAFRLRSSQLASIDSW